MIKAVIFDLDDTLISERKYIESGYSHISYLLSKELNKEQNEIYDLLFEIFEQSPQRVFNRFFDILGVNYTQEKIFKLVEEYRNHFPTIRFYDDVIPCINDLKKLEIKLGIITDGYANAQRQKLTALKAYDYFDEVIITDELGKRFWKPHPKSFEIIKEKLNVEFDEMIYVGDNPKKDFYIGKVYPIRTVMINRKSSIYKNEAYYKNIKELYRIKSLHELMEVIQIITGE